MEKEQDMHSTAHSGIRVNALRKTFQPAGVVACDDVDLDIPNGELLVLLGPSGPRSLLGSRGVLFIIVLSGLLRRLWSGGGRCAGVGRCVYRRLR